MSPRGRSLVILALLAAALQTGGTLAPGPLTWGVHHYAFLPIWLQAAAALLLLVTIVPGPRDALAAGLTRFTSGLSAPGAARGAALVTLAAAVGLFWLGRSRTFFMSDGELLLRDIQRGVLSAFEADTLSAPFHLWFNTFLRNLGITSWTASFRIISIGAGVIWISCIMALVGRLTKNGTARFFLAALFLTAGMTRLFYGYVETSPLVAAAVAIYLWAAIRCLDEGKGVTLLIAAFTLAVAMHVTAFLFFPSLAYVLLVHGGAEQKRRPLVLAAAVIPLLAMPLFWLIRGRASEAGGAFEAYMAKFVPLSGPLLPKQAYTFFSPGHAIEFLNEQLLLGPLAFFGFLIVLFFSFRTPAEEPPTGDEKRIPHLGTFLILMAAPILLLSLVYNRELGGARDWDLLANATLPCLLLVGLAVLREPVFAPGGKGRGVGQQPGPLPKIAVALLGVSLVHLAGWVLIDTDAGRSLKHLKVLFGPGAPVSRFASAYAFEETGRYYLEHDDPDNARISFEAGLAVDPSDFKVMAPLAHLHTLSGDHEKAAFYYREAVRLRPAMVGSYVKLAESLTAVGRGQEAAEAYREGLRVDPEQAAVWQEYGNLLFGLGDLPAARGAYEEALKRKPGDPDLGFNIGFAFETEGKNDEALAAYRSLLKTSPEHLATLFGTGTLLLRTGRVEESLELFHAVLKLQPGARDVSINLAVANAQIGRFEAAGLALEKIPVADEPVIRAYIDVAKIAEAQKKTADAILLLDACRKRNGPLSNQLGVSTFMDRIQPAGRTGSG